MRITRIIGNNIKLLLQENEVTFKNLADATGFSEKDIQKMCEGRLFITNKDLEEIADVLNVNKDYFFQKQPKEKYVGKYFPEHINGFMSEKNEELIMDLFDMYCDVAEALI